MNESYTDESALSALGMEGDGTVLSLTMTLKGITEEETIGEPGPTRGQWETRGGWHGEHQDNGEFQVPVAICIQGCREAKEDEVSHVPLAFPTRCFGDLVRTVSWRGGKLTAHFRGSRAVNWGDVTWRRLLRSAL